MTRVVPWALVAVLGCDLGDEGIPEGKLATVGDTVFGPEDVAQVRAQLGAYAQLRFEGRQGRRTLLDALVDAELLAQEAVDHGLGRDPRVAYAVFEEIATVYIGAEVERRVPVAAIEADVDALRAYYDAHPEAFVVPQRRSIRGVVFQSSATADAALEAVRAGRKDLEDYGKIFTTELQARDDQEYPAFHPILFDPTLREGDVLAHPVYVGESMMVARLHEVELQRLEPFDVPDVRARLVQAVRAQRQAAAEVELREELRARDPDE